MPEVRTKPAWGYPRSSPLPARLRGAFRGYEILCPPPPTGGTVLVEMLNILEDFDLRAQGRWSPATVHLMIEAMRLAHFDRACYLADPQFIRVSEFLVDKTYARSSTRSWTWC